jgi:hypothetical protein
MRESARRRRRHIAERIAKPERVTCITAKSKSGRDAV